MPLTLIDTRDCFAFDLIVDKEIVSLGPGREKVIKKTYYFDPEVVPDNFSPYVTEDAKKDVSKKSDYHSYPAGCTSYENFFTHSEMKDMEQKIEATEKLCSDSK